MGAGLGIGSIMLILFYVIQDIPTIRPGQHALTPHAGHVLEKDSDIGYPASYTKHSMPEDTENWLV
jgi:hypothetical protein